MNIRAYPSKLRSAAQQTLPLSGLRHALRTHWTQLQARERMWIGLAAILLFVVLTWLLAFAPALSVLRHAPTQIDHLQTEHARMTRWASAAVTWREQARSRPHDARTSLHTTTRATLADKASIGAEGEQALVRLQEVDGAELLDWLRQVRIEARLIPVATRLQSDPNGLWTGTVSFLLENGLQ